MKNTIFLLPLIVFFSTQSFSTNEDDCLEPLKKSKGRGLISKVRDWDKEAFDTIFKDLLLKKLKLPGIRDLNNASSLEGKKFGIPLIKEKISAYSFENPQNKEKEIIKLVVSYLKKDKSFRTSLENTLVNYISSFVEKNKAYPSIKEIAQTLDMKEKEYILLFGAEGELIKSLKVSKIISKKYPELAESIKEAKKGSIELVLHKILKKHFLNNFNFEEFDLGFILTDFTLSRTQLFKMFPVLKYKSGPAKLLKQALVKDEETKKQLLMKLAKFKASSAKKMGMITSFGQIVKANPDLKIDTETINILLNEKDGIMKKREFHYFMLKNFFSYFEKVSNAAYFTKDRAVERLQESKKYTKFMFTSIVAGAKAHEGVDAMVAMAEKQKALPVIWILEEASAIIDPYFYELDEQGKILLLERSVEFNPLLRAINSGAHAKRVNGRSALNGLDKTKSGILIHPFYQLTGYTEANSGGLQGEGYVILETGSMSGPNYDSASFSHSIQRNTSNRAKKAHTISFVYSSLDTSGFEKLGIKKAGTPFSYSRPVMWNHKHRGFLDVGNIHKLDGSQQQIPYHGIFLGDSHGIQLDGRFADQIVELIHNLNFKVLYLNDSLDGFSIKHHIRKSHLKMSELVESGGYDAVAELRHWVATMEALLLLKKDFIIYDLNSNHNRWFEQLVKYDRYLKDFTVYGIGRSIADIMLDKRMNPLEVILKYGLVQKGQVVIPPLPKQLANRVVIQKSGEPLHLMNNNFVQVYLDHGDKAASPFSRWAPGFRLVRKGSQKKLDAHGHAVVEYYMNHDEQHIRVGHLIVPQSYAGGAGYSRVAGKSIALIAGSEFDYQIQPLFTIGNNSDRLYPESEEQNPELAFPEGYPKINEALEKNQDHDLGVGGGVDQHSMYLDQKRKNKEDK